MFERLVVYDDRTVDDLRIRRYGRLAPRTILRCVLAQAYGLKLGRPHCDIVGRASLLILNETLV